MANIIIAGDFNAKSIVFVGNITNAHGKFLEDCMTNAGFTCRNTGAFSFQAQIDSNSGSVLDLPFTKIKSKLAGKANLVKGKPPFSNNWPRKIV